jgi:hypothetical protein
VCPGKKAGETICTAISASRIGGFSTGHPWLSCSLCREGFEKDPGSPGCFHEMVPNPVDLQAPDLTCHASQPGGKLRGDQKEPGLQGEVDRLTSKHAANVRDVPSDPIEVTEASNQELVTRGRVKVDNRELVCSIDRQEIDLATGRTGNRSVESPQPFLERPFEFLQGCRDLLAGDVSRRPK